MVDRSSLQDLSLWRRYRRPALTSLAAVIAVVIVRLAFPGADLSRGSSDRWWLFGALLLVALVAAGIHRLIRSRRGSAERDDEAA